MRIHFPCLLLTIFDLSPAAFVARLWRTQGENLFPLRFTRCCRGGSLKCVTFIWCDSDPPPSVGGEQWHTLSWMDPVQSIVSLQWAQTNIYVYRYSCANNECSDDSVVHLRVNQLPLLQSALQPLWRLIKAINPLWCKTRIYGFPLRWSVSSLTAYDVVPVCWLPLFFVECSLCRELNLFLSLLFLFPSFLLCVRLVCASCFLTVLDSRTTVGGQLVLTSPSTPPCLSLGAEGGVSWNESRSFLCIDSFMPLPLCHTHIWKKTKNKANLWHFKNVMTESYDVLHKPPERRV